MEIHPDLIELIEYYAGSLDMSDIENISLYHDLSVHGDDADEILEQYATKFNVTFTPFRFTDYFPNEGDPIPGILWRIITRKPEPEYKRLTIGDLQRGIETKRMEL